MTLTMNLDSETGRRLQASAKKLGADEARLAQALLADALRNQDGMIDAETSGEDWTQIEEALRRSEADFAAGRFRSLDVVRADKRTRFGV